MPAPQKVYRHWLLIKGDRSKEIFVSPDLPLDEVKKMRPGADQIIPWDEDRGPEPTPKPTAEEVKAAADWARRSRWQKDKLPELLPRAWKRRK